MYDLCVAVNQTRKSSSLIVWRGVPYPTPAGASATDAEAKGLLGKLCLIYTCIGHRIRANGDHGLHGAHFKALRTGGAHHTREREGAVAPAKGALRDPFCGLPCYSRSSSCVGSLLPQ